MWFLRSGSCIRLVGRNQLWHSCTSGLFTGQINQAAPGLGYCPESTVWRESHLTPVHGLKGASIITIQHSPCHLPFLFSSASSSCSFSSRHLGPVLRFYHHHFSFLPLPAFSTSPSPRMICYSLHTLQLNRLPSESCDLRRHVIVPPHWLYAPQISCDSFLLHCLPAWRRKQSYCNHIQICSIWNGHSSVPSFFRLIYFVVYNVCCYSSEYWFENEDQMEKVIMDTEMFMTRNKQELALKYHKSQPLPLTSISGWNVGHIFLFWVRSRSCWNLKWLQKNRWKKFLLFTTSSLYILQNEVIYN